MIAVILLLPCAVILSAILAYAWGKEHGWAEGWQEGYAHGVRRGLNTRSNVKLL